MTGRRSTRASGMQERGTATVVRRNSTSSSFTHGESATLRIWHCMFVEDLKTLTDQAFPDLQEVAREHSALTQYLEQLETHRWASEVTNNC